MITHFSLLTNKIEKKDFFYCFYIFMKKKTKEKESSNRFQRMCIT